MKICDVCQEETIGVVPVADRGVAGFLLVCADCAGCYEQDHFEDLFRSPIDFDLLNADRRVLRQAA